MIYKTEDGESVETGDRVFNYYDHEPGTIGRDAGEGWFMFANDVGERTLLNGPRICSLSYASHRGWV